MPKLTSVIDASRTKRVTRQAIHLAIRRGDIDYHQFGGVKVVIINQKFVDWKPRRNPNGREAILRD